MAILNQLPQCYYSLLQTTQVYLIQPWRHLSVTDDFTTQNWTEYASLYYMDNFIYDGEPTIDPDTDIAYFHLTGCRMIWRTFAMAQNYQEIITACSIDSGGQAVATHKTQAVIGIPQTLGILAVTMGNSRTDLQNADSAYFWDIGSNIMVAAAISLNGIYFPMAVATAPGMTLDQIKVGSVYQPDVVDINLTINL